MILPIKLNEVYFHFDIEDTHNVHVYLKDSNNFFSETLWECHLQGLWEDDSIRENDELRIIWDMHNEGDFFQQTLKRHNKKLHPNISYTAWFHNLIIKKREELAFIKNLYSTSMLEWLSMGFTFSEDAENFWKKQVQNGHAQYIVNQERYRLII